MRILVLTWACATCLASARSDEPAGLIDRRIQEKWRQMGLKPAAPASDAEFLRRVRLDLTGVIPSAEEVQGFLKDPDPRKRERKIDELLGSRAHARYWAHLWTVTLVGWFKKAYYYPHEIESLREWLEVQFHRNVPWTRISQALLFASGDQKANRAVNFPLAYRFDGPEGLTNQVTRVFLGYRLQCAQCHDHDAAHAGTDGGWTQEDFYGFASFFARMEGTRYETWVHDRQTGDGLTPQGWKGPVPPKFLNGISPQTPLWRQELALLVTRHPQLSKTFVNRAWTFLMGRGIVHPPDNFNPKNPPSHPELLEELARDFVAHGYDIRKVLRSITNSKAYQLSSESAGFDGAHRKYFVHAIPKLLSPDQLFASLVQLAGPREEDDLLQREAFLEKFAGGLSSEASDSNSYVETSQAALTKLSSDFLKEFGGSRDGGILSKLLAAPWERRIELAYLSVLGRRPTGQEERACREYLAPGESKDAGKALRELCAVLINLDEFNFNH